MRFSKHDNFIGGGRVNLYVHQGGHKNIRITTGTGGRKFDFFAYVIIWLRINTDLFTAKFLKKGIRSTGSYGKPPASTAVVKTDLANPCLSRVLDLADPKN